MKPSFRVRQTRVGMPSSDADALKEVQMMFPVGDRKVPGAVDAMLGAAKAVAVVRSTATVAFGNRMSIPLLRRSGIRGSAQARTPAHRGCGR